MGKTHPIAEKNVLREIPRVTSVRKLDIGLKSAELKWSRRWSKKTVMMMQIMNSLGKYRPKTMLSGKRIYNWMDKKFNSSWTLELMKLVFHSIRTKA